MHNVVLVNKYTNVFEAASLNVVWMMYWIKKIEN